MRRQQRWTGPSGRYPGRSSGLVTGALLGVPDSGDRRPGGGRGFGRLTLRHADPGTHAHGLVVGGAHVRHPRHGRAAEVLVGRRRSAPKLVLAYIDIGEAEDWRWYWAWSQEWPLGEPKPDDWPAYILTHDPDGWEGNYPVAYWDPEWKDIIIYGLHQSSAPYGDYASVIDEVLRSGFDGIYLDWVEAFENEEVRAAADAAGLDPAEEMIGFIGEMRAYARQRDPDFLIVQQNAAALIDGHPELLDAIDAIAQEAIWFDGEATDDWDDPQGHDSINEQDLVSYYTEYLDQYLGVGVPVFDCEYAVENAAEAYSRSADRGYVPYATRRSLARLTTTPPPG
ncbi:MAG: endo alpha-1,4 polygalactosaminidase [Planctomycetota bacterium]